MRSLLYFALALAGCSAMPQGQKGRSLVELPDTSAAAGKRVNDVKGFRFRLVRLSRNGQLESRVYQVRGTSMRNNLGFLTAHCEGSELVGASFEPAADADANAVAKAATNTLCL